MIFDLAGELFEGVIKGVGKTGKFAIQTKGFDRKLVAKQLKNKGSFSKAYDNFVSDYKRNKDYYYDDIAIPGVDHVVGGAIGLTGTVLNRIGQMAGTALGTVALGVGGLAYKTAKLGYKGLVRGYKIPFTGGKYQTPSLWTVARTLAYESPHEAWALTKLAFKGAKGAFNVGKKAVRLTNTPTIGLATVGVGGLVGLGVGDVMFGGTSLHSALQSAGVNDFGLANKLQFKVNKKPNQPYWYDEESGQLLQSKAPDGNYWLYDSSQIFTGNVYSPNNKRSPLHTNGADGSLVFALHQAR
ncbi:MAG: hypothetical protein N2043_02375 [Ignavibacterium sp.]|nr:hypothetical protein [Ignavibacterium sp.]